jgi:hypothetical protein
VTHWPKFVLCIADARNDTDDVIKHILSTQILISRSDHVFNVKVRYTLSESDLNATCGGTL